MDGLSAAVVKEVGLLQEGHLFGCWFVGGGGMSGADKHDYFNQVAAYIFNEPNLGQDADSDLKWISPTRIRGHEGGSQQQDRYPQGGCHRLKKYIGQFGFFGVTHMVSLSVFGRAP